MKLFIPNQNTPVLCQGITSSMGTIHTEMALVYGTNIVAGIAREKGLKSYLEVPVFQTVKEAVRKTHPQVSVVFSTPVRALADVEEAIRAKIPLVICTTEHVPMHDALKMKELAAKFGVQLIGPSSPGLVNVDKCVVGMMPAHLFPKGNVGIVTRSSSLAYEAARQLYKKGLGVSTCVALGTAPVSGMDFISVVQAFLSDPRTKAILVIGELRGIAEFDLAQWYQTQKRQKPLLVYISGKSFKPSKKLPLLGAENARPEESIAEKQEALKATQATLVYSSEAIGETVLSVLRKE